MSENDKKKRCFVVGPIGDDPSEDRIHADWLLEEIIAPVFNDHFKEFRVDRADKISDPGRIDTQVISALLEAELVIADLTNLNPNAFYEIGIRHAVQKPIIHMHLEGQRIPFDIASFRSIKFNRIWPREIRAAREALKASVDSVLAPDFVLDNPVTFTRGRVAVETNATSTERVLQGQIEGLERRLRNVEDSSDRSVIVQRKIIRPLEREPTELLTGVGSRRIHVRDPASLPSFSHALEGILGTNYIEFDRSSPGNEYLLEWKGGRDFVPLDFLKQAAERLGIEILD